MALTNYETAQGIVFEYDRIDYKSEDAGLIGGLLAGLTAAVLAQTDQLERIADHMTEAKPAATPRSNPYGDDSRCRSCHGTNYQHYRNCPLRGGV